MMKLAAAFLNIIAALTLNVSVAQSNPLAKYDEAGLRHYKIKGNVWKNLSRDEIYSLIDNIPNEPNSVLTRELARHLLLTQSSFDDIEDLKEGEESLIDVRIEKLMAMGEYSLALDLVISKGKKFPNPTLAATYARLLILNGQSSVACIEANIWAQKFSSSSQLKDLQAYCKLRYAEKSKDEQDSTLEHVVDPIIRKALIDNSLSFSYKTVNDLQLVPPYRLAVLASMERVNLSRFKRALFKQLPSSHIIPLLNSSILSEGDRVALSLIGFSRGLVDAEHQMNLMSKIYDRHKNQEFSQSTPEHIQLSKLFSSWSVADISTKNRYIEKIIKLDKTYPGALSLLAYVISERDIKETLITNHWREILPTLSLGNPSLTKVFIRHKIKLLEQSSPISKAESQEVVDFLGKNLDFLTLAFIYDVLPSNTRKHYVKQTSKNLFYTKTFKESSDLYIKIVSALDKGISFDHNPASIYEKQKDSSALQYTQYNMPSALIWDSLKKSDRENKSGLFVFTSLEQLQEQKAYQTYPLLLHDIIQGMVNVGNTKMARLIAMQAIIGH